jgi:hypothetical protein
MATISVTIEHEADVTWVAGQANQTLAQWVQSRVTELDAKNIKKIKK